MGWWIVSRLHGSCAYDLMAMRHMHWYEIIRQCLCIAIGLHDYSTGVWKDEVFMGL